MYGPLSKIYALSTLELEPVKKRLGGSTGARLYQDKKGRRWVFKAGTSSPHIYNEIIANYFYDLADVDVPACFAALNDVTIGSFFNDDARLNPEEQRLCGGFMDVIQLTEFIDGKLLADIRETPEVVHAIQADYIVDIFLGNDDVLGAENDNIIVVNPKGDEPIPFRIDNGGALLYRAQGLLKPATRFISPDMRNYVSRMLSKPFYRGMTMDDLRDQFEIHSRGMMRIIENSPPSLRGIMERRYTLLEEVLIR